MPTKPQSVFFDTELPASAAHEHDESSKAGSRAGLARRRRLHVGSAEAVAGSTSASMSKH
eukprot:5552113-Prymnesium_polylepis.2